MAQSLKQKLDKLYDGYDFQGRIAHDPIELPHQYSRPEDIELSAFIASCFAYGNVKSFKPFVKELLSRMGQSPFDYLSRFDIHKHRNRFQGLKYRFNTNNDVLGLLYVLNRVIKKFSSIEEAFKRHYSNGDESIAAGLAGMIDIFLGFDTSAVHGNNEDRKGFRQFFPSPLRGSACKRMNMFLRWMIRDRDIDFGIWSGVPKNRLVIPLDVHIARISRCIGLTQRSGQDWKTAVEITESLRKIDPEDPVKYDFALCHQGISRVCSSRRCGECTLKP